MGAPQFEQAGADISGTGTTNTIPRWTGPSTLGDSGLIDNGTAIYTTARNAIGFNTATPTANTFNFGASRFAFFDDSQTKLGDDGIIRGLAATGDTGLSYYTSKAFNIRRGNTFVATFDTSGNVGIGTASPAGKLEVSGASDQTVWITATSAGSTTLSLYPSGGGLAQINAVGASNLAFRTNSTERARISNAGTQAQSQVAIGTSSFTTGRALTTVADLDVFGVRVGRGANTSSTANVCVGATALDSGTVADYVTAIGTQAIQRHNGLDNTAMGYAAHRGSSTLANNTGIRNTALGILSLTAISTGSNNTAVGSRAGDSITTGSSNIIIGSDADLAAATDSNKLVIGDATNYVATNGGATTYYATAGALAGYIIVRLNGTDVKLPVYAL